MNLDKIRQLQLALCFALVIGQTTLAAPADETLAARFAPLGTLIVTQFVSAPFPHPQRATGHKYHDEFFSAADHYSDSTVAMFIPKNFHAADKIDFVVHFHGWNNTVAGTIEQFNLIEQFCASGRNAVLVMPEGPYNAPDSFGGRLEDTNGFKVFMEEALEKLCATGASAKLERRSPARRVSDQHRAGPETGAPEAEGRPPEIGDIILSGHSGGYHVMSAILDHGGLPGKIREAWLFDALYGGTDNFVAWQIKANGRLLDIYTDHGGTREETERLMDHYRSIGVPFFAAEETNAITPNLLTNKIIFLHTDLTHNEVIFRRGEFRQSLETSCLEKQ